METTHVVHIKLVLFSVIDGNLSIYVPDRKLPLSVVRKGKLLDEELNGLIRDIGFSPNDGFFEQLYTLSDTHARNNVVFVVYYLLIADYLLPSTLRRNFIRHGDMKVSGEDAQILSYAIQRLQWKIEYTNVIYSLLPENFTLGELQHIYEAILNRRLDKRNFH